MINYTLLGLVLIALVTSGWAYRVGLKINYLGLGAFGTMNLMFIFGIILVLYMKGYLG